MIKITIRDGRVGRRVAEDGKGEVLATTEVADFLDIGSKIRLPDGVDVVVIGDEIEILKESAQQTVYVGTLPTPVAAQPKTIRFDVGSHDGWTLQRADGDSTTFIRALDDAEVEEIETAVAFCREHVISPVYRLLTSSHQVWKQTYDRVAKAKREAFSPSLSGELLGVMAGWLLIWRLVLDQSAHNLSQRFGRESAQFADFSAATNRAYDSSQAYRVVEALRNEVQHREMPPLEVTRTKTIDRMTGHTAETFSCKFPVSYLLESEKCKNKIREEFAQTPGSKLDVGEIVESAMSAMSTVLLELAKISTPEFDQHVKFLRDLFRETDPVPPLLLRVTPSEANQGGLNVAMKPLLDVAFVVQNAPISADPTKTS